jgi:enoyl-CoA hydratase
VSRDVETSTEKLLATVDSAGVLRITLHNPKSLNSLTAEMLSGLQTLMAEASTADDVRAVLLVGAGQEAFASGADIGEHSARAHTGATNPDRGDFVTRLLACTKPVVAMIHGYCLGGGLLVAMSADIRLAAHDAQFSIPAARLGVAYPLAAVELLVDIVGRGAASKILLTGDRIDAHSALSMGLLTGVVPKADLAGVVEDMMQTLTRNAPLSMFAAKASIAHAGDIQRSRPSHVVAMIDEVWASADAKEGMDAFFAKRPPQFKGR